ncbi:hypothetical protein [Actinacidiphila yeochonensis]|uniref:hypothetical protein n=1 Tax=Actinacidiphila yeochonensis TaxID=89050 RepID=UPI00055CF01B|nr:hypothetical protein [Actinacidiphila yeochonensis]
MTIRRTATALGALSLGLLSLTACDKPTAQATVTVGSKSVQAEARPACRASDDKPLDQTTFVACLNGTPTHHMTVPVGDQVRIGVDPSIGDKGWLIAADNALVTPELLKDKTYWSVDSAQLFQDQQTGTTKSSVTLAVVESTDTTGKDSYRVIQFKLVRGK